MTILWHNFWRHLLAQFLTDDAFNFRLVSPRFGHLVAQEAEKKGYLRHVHGRIVSNSEEIAFYNGHRVEQSHLRSAYRILTHHLEHMFAVKLWFVMLEQFLMKYVWSGTGSYSGNYKEPCQFTWCCCRYDSGVVACLLAAGDQTGPS